MKYKTNKNKFRKTMGFKPSKNYGFKKPIGSFKEGFSEFKKENKLEKGLKGAGYIASSAILTGAVLYGLLGNPETQYNGPAYENPQDTSKVGYIQKSNDEYRQDSTKYQGGVKK